MTHMHVAGSLHAEAAGVAPQWLVPPQDVNALLPTLWSRTTSRAEDGQLVIGGLPVTEIVERTGTPVYLLDEDDLRSRCREYAEAFAGWGIHYASKAFTCRGMARILAEEGLGMDVASLGELEVALSGGVPGADLVLHGNNKSELELRRAVEVGVGRIVVDSSDEIDRLSRIAGELGVKAKVMVRVTTGVEAHTHEYIATAHDDQKFGFSLTQGRARAALDRVEVDRHLELVGIHSHIGSQIFDVSGFEVACRKVFALHAEVAEAYGRELPEVNLGGGFGIAYISTDEPLTPAELATRLREIVELECKARDLQVPRLSIEPGRSIVGPAGIAIYRVGTVKQVDVGGGHSRAYVAVDGGMSDNIRPSLYAAEYSATLANRRSDATARLSRVVGVHCESGDILVRDEFLPSDVAIGDLIAVPGSGAYSRSMASNYNHVPRPPVVAVRDGELRTLIRRETLDDIFALDVG
ncbi:MAG: diaminopimelate decarboxylase [Propionibacterium sp.]|nr:diaminopimelate decarboxylase [Propionibacterium sp.]